MLSLYSHPCNIPVSIQNRIQAAGMKYLRTVKGCTRLDQLRNEDIRNELGKKVKNNRIQE
jgi:hypothetical protein